MFVFIKKMIIKSTLLANFCNKMIIKLILFANFCNYMIIKSSLLANFCNKMIIKSNLLANYLILLANKMSLQLCLLIKIQSQKQPPERFFSTCKVKCTKHSNINCIYSVFITIHDSRLTLLTIKMHKVYNMPPEVFTSVFLKHKYDDYVRLITDLIQSILLNYRIPFPLLCDFSLKNLYSRQICIENIWDK